MKPLLPHQAAWLSAHPERTEAWLRRMMADGFDIHHLDGEHSNNEPSNLILVEHRDHFMLHSGKRPLKLRLATKGPRPETLTLGQAAQALREEGYEWCEVGYRLGVKGTAAARAAKVHRLHRQSQEAA